MVIQYFVYAAVGRLVIFTLQKFPFDKIPFIREGFTNGRFFDRLFSCDFCLGFWVYTALAPLFKINIIEYFYVPIISWCLTGVITSFIMHLVSNGWKALYNVTVIGGD